MASDYTKQNLICQIFFEQDLTD